MELDNSGFFRPMPPDRVKIRLLPVSNDSTIFTHTRVHKCDPISEVIGRSIKPQERYYHACVVKGQEGTGPQLLSVSRATHFKIMEAWLVLQKKKLRWYQKVAACVRWFFEKINVLRPLEPEIEPGDFVFSRDRQGFVRIDPA